MHVDADMSQREDDRMTRAADAIAGELASKEGARGHLSARRRKALQRSGDSSVGRVMLGWVRGCVRACECAGVGEQ
jgi:hypothetical protein